MEIELFNPYKKQREFIESFGDTEDLFGVVVAPRGSGKTLLGINLMLYWLLSHPNRKGGWISPVYQQAKSVLDTIVSTSNPVVSTSNRMEATITFINGSTLKFLSADSADNIRGFRFTHLVIDEMAFVKDTILGATILPTLNPNGKKCLMISTPKGRNHFYDWYMKEDVVSTKFPLTECPYVNQELVQEAKASLPPELFKQEYLAEFVDSANDVFTGTSEVSIVQSFEPGKGQDAFIGIDTGLTSDKSVLTIISPMGRVLWVEHTNNENINTIATRFTNIMSGYNIVGGYIETNGIGRGMYDLVAPKFRKVKGWNTTQDNKTEMVRKLIHDIETTTIELPSEELLPDLHREFTQFAYKMSPTGKLSFGHVSGGHDDFIDSLMMANYSRVSFMERKPIRIAQVRGSNLKPSFGNGPR